jgi:small subunit ribosomal protein S16
MSVKIRLARRGTKKRPVYALVATNSRSARDGRFLEKLGTYNPLHAHDHKEHLVVNGERVKHWLGVGAIASDRAARLLSTLGLVPKPTYNETPKKSAPGKKATDRAEAKVAKEQKRLETLREAEEAAKAAALAPAPVAEVVAETAVEAEATPTVE